MNQHLAKQLAPDALGGTVPWQGAVPCSFPCRKVAHEARIAARYGVQTGSVDIDFARVMERMNEIRDGSREGLRSWLESEDAVTLFSGWGRFAGDKEIAVGETTVTGETIFVNVGPQARIPDIPGLDTVDWLDNRRVLELTEVPAHVIIVGGSYIGLEFVQLFHRFGAEVTILERAPRIIGREDPDISDALQTILEDEGLQFILNASVDRVRRAASGPVTVELTVGDSKARSVGGSHLLIGAGRTPNTDQLDPEAGHITTDDRGHIVVDDVLQTSARGVYALGDVNSTIGSYGSEPLRRARMHGFRMEIQPSQQPVGEEEAPDPVVDFEESDIAPGQHRTDKQLPVLQANGAAAGDLSPFTVTGIPRHREPRRHRMRARRKGIRRDGVV